MDPKSPSDQTDPSSHCICDPDCRPSAPAAEEMHSADMLQDNTCGERCSDRFWRAGEELDQVEIRIEPPEIPLELLEQLGTSPFERGGFPLIGFLATTYDKVSRDALDRG